MTARVKLSDIVEGLEFQSDERSSYLNTVTGEVVSVTHEELRAAEEEQPLEIRGRGAFRRFKDRMQAYGIAEAWYRYRDEALRELAIAWCEEHGMRYTET